MNILLVVSSANDVFIYNLAKWLKQSVNCTLDAFELNPSSNANQEDSSDLFETIGTASRENWWWRNIISRFVLSPIMFARQLDRFVSRTHYDVIHVQGVWPYIPLTRKLKSQATRLFVSFWGNEHLMGKVWHSHTIYKYKLSKFIQSVDGITGSRARLRIMHELFPNTHLYESRLGIASLDSIVQLTKTLPKEDSKSYWKMPINKVSVLIGYSGKRLHNHLEIINRLSKHWNLRDRIHLLAPMTRGASSDYVIEVETALARSGFTYTLLKDRFLSDEEIARFRHATDIVFQFADNDAYSRSIIESICAGAVLVYGDWIEYKELLADDGFDAFAEESIEGGIEVLRDFLESPEKYKRVSEKNLAAGCGQFLWSECIMDFVRIYTGKQNVEVF